MTTGKNENHTKSYQDKKQQEQEKANKTAVEIQLEEMTQASLLTRDYLDIESSEREVKLEGGEKKAIQMYEEWLKQYKQKNPDFDEEKNKFKIDENGDGCICFSDPKAEEDFVRHLAANSPQGSVLDKGVLIAKFEDGKLIDP